MADIQDNINVIMYNDNSCTNRDDLSGKIEFVKRSKKYIPLRSNRNLIRIACTIIGLIFLISITTICTFNSHDIKNAFIQSDGIFLIDDEGILFFELEISKFTRLVESDDKIQAFGLHSDKSLIWSAENTTKFYIFPTKYNNISHTRKWKPQAIDVDYKTGNIYIIHKSTGTLNVMDSKGENFNVIFSDLDKPHDLALDVERGLIFFSLQYKSIQKVFMDGTKMTTIVNDTGVSIITIDSVNERIYWASDHFGIKASDYEGKNCKTIKEYVIQFKGLTYYKNQLFWMISHLGYNNETLTSCQIQEDECINFTHHHIFLQNPRMLKAPINLSNNQIIMENPCQSKDFRKCSHLCLLSENGLPKCACKIGWQLNSDLKSCRQITEFALILVDNIMKTQILNVNSDLSFTDVIVPIELDIDPRYYGKIDFDYHLRTYDVYFVWESTINKINLHDEDKQSLVFEIESGYTIASIAIDWISENLFYIKKSYLADENLVMVMSLNNYLLHKTIRRSREITFELNDCPYSLIVHAKLGKLFFTLWDGSVDLYSMDIVNSSNRVRGLSISYMHSYNSLALNYRTDRIYFIKNQLNDISSANLQFDDEKNIMLPCHIQEMNSIFVYDDDIYISTENSIWLFQTIENPTIQIYPKFSYAPIRSISAVKIFSSKIQTINNDEYCYEGYCEQFCFAKPEKICACVDDKKLTNGKQCI